MLSTKHLVLGLVIDRPGYGYELQQRIVERFGFLDLSDAFVYRALDRLECDGLVTESGPKPVGQTRRGSPRVMYAPTERGGDEFRRWMTTPSGVALVRDELHVKLVLAEPADREHLIEQTIALERSCLAQLRALARPPLHEVVDAEMPWAEVAAVLVDDARAARLQATVEWLQRVRTVLERRLPAPAALRSAS